MALAEIFKHILLMLGLLLIGVALGLAALIVNSELSVLMLAVAGCVLLASSAVTFRFVYRIYRWGRRRPPGND